MNIAYREYLLTAFSVSQAYAGGSTYDNFNPISGLHQTDGDVYLIFLMNMAQFLGPVQDPWYYSNRTWVNPFTGTSQLYFAADPVTGLGCKQQHQLCNGATCTQMTGLVALYNSIVPTDKNILGLSAEQKALAYHIFNGTLMQNTIGAVLNDLDNQALLAQDQVEGTSVLSTALPPYQWVMEVSNWMNIVLASMQRLAVSYATDSVSSDAKNYLVRPENDLQRQLCGAQLIRSSTAAGVSFSVLWTSLILIVGVIVIILDFSLSSAVGWIQKKSRKGLDRRAEWILNNTLQIQRVAFEGDRQGNWDRKEASVPTTQRGEMLSIVGMSDGVARRSTYESERASYGYSPMEKNGPGVSVTNSSPYEYNRVQ